MTARRFAYEDRTGNETGFTGTTTTLPIRFADVEVCDTAKSGSKAILAKGKSAADGTFVYVSDSSTRKVRVRVFTQTVQTGDPSSFLSWTAPRSDAFCIRSRHAADVGIHGTYFLSVARP